MIVTESELLDALRDALIPVAGTEDGYTTRELSEKLGRSTQIVRRALQAAMREGRIEYVKVTRMQINGVPSKTDGYRLRG